MKPVDTDTDSSEAMEMDLGSASRAGGELVLKFEDHFDVNSLLFRGVKVWPRLRSMMVFAFSDGLFEAPAAPVKRYGALASIDDLLAQPVHAMATVRELADAVGRVAKDNRSRPLMFLGRQPRQVVVAGKTWDVLFDPLATLADDEIPRPFVKLAMGSGPEGSIRQTDNLIEANLDPLVDWLARNERFHDLFTHPPANPREVAGLDAFIAALPLALRDRFAASEVVKDMAFIERVAIVFRLYLEAAKPPCVFFSGHRRVNMAMTLAARRLGIPTIDIQHGAAAYSPSGYKWHSWKQIPNEGYDLLPDYFWVWGERPASMIRRHANPACPYHKPIVGGHPALLTAYGDEFPERFLSKISGDRQVVLATLGHLGKDGFPGNLLEAIRLAPKKWFWLLRLHPNDLADTSRAGGLRAKLDAAGIRNFELDVSSSEPLHKLLPHVDRHVTPYSSSAVEATAFGVPTVFIHPLAQEVFGHILSLNGMQYAEEPEKIVAKLSRPVASVERLVEADREKALWMLQRLASRRKPFPYKRTPLAG